MIDNNNDYLILALSNLLTWYACIHYQKSLFGEKYVFQEVRVEEDLFGNISKIIAKF